MRVVNCECCGKIFNHLTGIKICKECDTLVFKNIKSYIENNHSATVYDISEDLKMPIKIVREYIKDDRITLMRNDVVLCKGCFDVIEKGDYCLACASKFELQNQISFTRPAPEKVKAKFHTKDFRR